MAKHYNIQQNTEEWYKLRSGIPAASSFKEILTPAKLELSKQSRSYMNHLIGERLAGHVLEFQSAAMQRGHELEPLAVKAYEFFSKQTVLPGGFWTDDAGRYGASPDGLIGDDAVLEIKCLGVDRHIECLRTGVVPREYWLQIQGQLLVTERKHGVYLSYYPDLPAKWITVERDEQAITALRDALTVFCDELENEYKRLKPV